MEYIQYGKKKGARQGPLHFLTVEQSGVGDDAKRDKDKDDIAQDGVERILHDCKSELIYSV